MEIYFAIDIKNGEVVWGHSGKREKYEPIHFYSKFVNSSHPIEVIKSIKPRNVYAADLDAITRNEKSNTHLLRDISKICNLIVDGGFKTRKELVDLPYTPVLGSETYDLRYVIDGVFVSLDFLDGFLDASGKLDLETALELLNSFKLRGVIVLDISRVGTFKLNFELLKKVLNLSDNPVYVGGGVKDANDLKSLKELGINGAIIATAVHRGKIPLSIIRKGEF